MASSGQPAPRFGASQGVLNRALALYAVAAAFFLGGCGGSNEPTDPKALAGCYEMEFDAPPPAAVGSLQAKQVIVRDSGAQWLRFTADAATIDSIVARGFQPSSAALFSGLTQNANAPSWWHPSADGLTTFYVHPDWKKHFGPSSSSGAYLAHDANKKLVYFMSDVSD